VTCTIQRPPRTLVGGRDGEENDARVVVANQNAPSALRENAVSEPWLIKQCGNKSTTSRLLSSDGAS
jgi:hypothetical protein